MFYYRFFCLSFSFDFVYEMPIHHSMPFRASHDKRVQLLSMCRETKGSVEWNSCIKEKMYRSFRLCALCLLAMDALGLPISRVSLRLPHSLCSWCNFDFVYSFCKFECAILFLFYYVFFSSLYSFFSILFYSFNTVRYTSAVFVARLLLPQF